MKNLQRMSLFIDGGNLYHAAKLLNFKIDFMRLKDYFVPEMNKLSDAFYYSAFNPSDEFIFRILDWLRHNGFVVRTKEVKKYPDKTMKGNLDVEIVIDMLTTIEEYDVAILFSGDGDFVRCVEELQKRGKIVHVVSTEKSDPSLLSKDLKKQANNFIDLFDIKEKITKR